MGYVCFYLAVGAACLLWTAIFTAAAARTRSGWTRWLLIAVAVGFPALSLMPWVVLTGALAFWIGLDTAWFGPTLTAECAALVGGIWIAIAGLLPRSDPAAARWPLLRLAACFIVSKLVIAGTLAILDEAARAEGRAARAEAAAMIQSLLPPALTSDDNAAPLYDQATALINADKRRHPDDHRLLHRDTMNAPLQEVREFLARQAITLGVLRRAADRPGCHFVVDWSRPSIATFMPSVSDARKHACFLALAARREAADGNVRLAIADIVRIHRIGSHLAEVPQMASIVHVIEEVGLQTLAAVLPWLRRDDANALEATALGDFIRSRRSPRQFCLGEEAFGLAAFADTIEGRAFSVIVDLGPRGMSHLNLVPPVNDVLGRIFLLPFDLRAYRECVDQLRILAEETAWPKQTYVSVQRRAETIDADFGGRHRGAVTEVMTGVLRDFPYVYAKSQVLHHAAEVLLAATRARLASGELPSSAESLVPDFMIALPRDPFVEDGPLLVTINDDGWLVYSVGRNGKDDGGPSRDDDDDDRKSDDIGLWLERSR